MKPISYEVAVRALILGLFFGACYGIWAGLIGFVVGVFAFTASEEKHPFE